VLERYALDARSVAPLVGGLINRTFSARRLDGIDCVLQRVSPLFPETIHDDIDAITHHLERKGLATPVLLRTQEGENRLRVDTEVWRLMTRIAGETHAAVPDDAAAQDAGRMLGAFHSALADFDQPLLNRRLGVHDTRRHLAVLRQTLAAQSAHPAHAAVGALAERIFAVAEQALAMSESRVMPAALPDRLVHGDPKISNVVFKDGRAVCLIDLDTLARMPVALELGDALRSWCNLESENTAAARFSSERFDAVLAGYAAGSGTLLTAAEWRAIPLATLTIAVELAARFAADALNESYFGWDPERFESASAHNLVRAAGQFSLAEQIREALMRLLAAPRCVE
jgi:Ser/Thr protein kinase RdoA (MazF antagonist)